MYAKNVRHCAVLRVAHDCTHSEQGWQGVVFAGVVFGGFCSKTTSPSKACKVVFELSLMVFAIYLRPRTFVML